MTVQTQHDSPLPRTYSERRRALEETRTLGYVRFRPGAATTRPFRSLDTLSRVGGYEWSSERLHQEAKEWFESILTLAHRHNLETETTARQSVEWLVAAILDHQHQDIDHRSLEVAREAAAKLPGQPEPLRQAEIPTMIQDEQGTAYSLKWIPVKFASGTPVEATSNLAFISLVSPPEEWFLATYEEYYRRRYDPVLYARYGNWYVEVARWDEPEAG